MGALMGAEGKASVFYIKCDDPANENAVIQEIHATRGLEDYQVETMDEWLEEMTPDKTAGFNIALNVVTCIAVLVGSWSSSSRCTRRCWNARGRSAS